MSVARRLRSALIVVALLVTPLACGWLAVVLAPPVRVTDVGLDGLDIEVRLVPGRTTVEVDSALLGGLRTRGPSVFGKPIGLEIRPSDSNLDLFGASGALDAGTIDVAGHLFADPQAQHAELTRIESSVIRYYGTVFAVTVYLLAVLEAFGWLYLTRRARTIRRWPGRYRRPVAAELRVLRAVAGVAAVAVLLPAGYLASPLSDDRVQITADPQLASTFLSGWQLTGPFTGLIRQAATSIDSLAGSEQDFYDRVSRNREAAYREHYGAADVPHDDDLLRLVILDDLQGTSGMARIVGEAAQSVHADGIVNLGDLTATGTAQESYLSYLKRYTVQVLAHYAADVPVYTSLGRHDTPTVAANAEKVGLTVADGAQHQVAGVPMIGVNSPYIVNFGEAARLKDPAVTTASVSVALRDEACRDRPFAVYAHDKELLDEVTASGCVPLVIGGHDYSGKPGENVDTPAGTVRRIILGSTGGHGAGDGLGGLTTPRNNAPFDLLSIDRTTGEVSVDVTTVHPDASVTIASTRLATLDGQQRARLG